MKQPADLVGSRVAEFYQSRGIAVDGPFNCANKAACTAAASDRGLRCGPEAHVGSMYRRLPRS